MTRMKRQMKINTLGAAIGSKVRFWYFAPVSVENLSSVIGVPCGNVFGTGTLNDGRKNTAGEFLTILLTDFTMCSNRLCHG